MASEFVLFQLGGGSGVFRDILQTADNLGFFLYLFPFLLALAIFFGILNWSVGERLQRGPTALISIILAFFVMLYSSFNTFIVSFFANLSGAGLVIGSGILLVIIFLGLAGFKLQDVFKEGHAKWAFVLFIIFIGILAFIGAGAGQFGLFPGFANDPQFITLIFFIVIIALAMWMMASGGKEEAAPSGGGRPG